MKKFIKQYNYIITIENLLQAWQEFLAGKKKRNDVALFQTHLMNNLFSLHEQLENGTYEHGKYFSFNISDPKPRNIHKATVHDRIIHHLLYKELYPYFDKKFIFDVYSCRLNKGTHRALNRFRQFARKVSKNHTKTCYVLKCDIKKFFANIDQIIFINILRKYIKDKKLIWLIEKIIFSFKTAPNIGLPLGNLTSQLFVNIYMNEFDQFVKNELKVKYYIRYADDFIFLSDSNKYLENLLSQVEKFLNDNLKLLLHENKIYIKTYASGVDFLGWVHFPHHRQIRTATKRRIIRNMRQNNNLQSLNSYRGLLKHGNTYKLQKYLNLA
jgi:retron-type reverse transcriptase